MSKSNYENLRVYNSAVDIADKVWNIVIDWDGFGKETIGKQLVRSSDSIGANIAEGSGRGTYKDYKKYLRISRGSLYETKHWLKRAEKRGLLNEKQVKELIGDIETLAPSLNAFINAIGIKNQELETTNN